MSAVWKRRLGIVAHADQRGVLLVGWVRPFRFSGKRPGVIQPTIGQRVEVVVSAGWIKAIVVLADGS